MTTADHIARLLRPIAPQQKFMQGDVDLINTLAASWDARGAQMVRPAVPQQTAGDPPWTKLLRAQIGQHEIKGPKHNTWISSGWAKLDAKLGLARRFNDDETPWCGFAQAWALDAAGLPFPRAYPSAASFAEYGVPCAAQLGAIGVKKRKGGNHVFQIVGVTADGKYYKALGGNQSDGVNIIDIAVADVTHIRWPKDQPQTGYLPVLPRGTISTKES